MTAQAPAIRRTRSRAIAELVPRCLGEALAAKGFAGTEVLTRWPEIAGPELAAHSQPLEIKWPRRASDDAAGREAATLVVRVTGSFALELQQQAPVLIERINTYLGWGGIGRIRIKQGPMPRPVPRAPPPPPLDPAVEARLAARVAGIADRRLAEALLRLGRGAATRR
jgi:hypothetical protein